MAASHTLSHSCAIPQISRHGILTLYGYGIRVTMQAGHLQIEDGIGPERRKCRLPRVGHGLKRLVCYDLWRVARTSLISRARWVCTVGNIHIC